jgi:hypothetical protein
MADTPDIPAQLETKSIITLTSTFGKLDIQLSFVPDQPLLAEHTLDQAAALVGMEAIRQWVTKELGGTDLGGKHGA